MDISIAERRETQLRTMINELSGIIHISNGWPLAAIFISAMTFLTFIRQQKRSILGIDLHS